MVVTMERSLLCLLGRVCDDAADSRDDRDASGQVEQAHCAEPPRFLSYGIFCQPQGLPYMGAGLYSASLKGEDLMREALIGGGQGAAGLFEVF
jgi:hypothetical protein